MGEVRDRIAAAEPPRSPREAELIGEYMQALHAMQTAVAFLMNARARFAEVEPKHLRVGINAAMSDHGALVRLLVQKGVIGREEYFEAIRDFARAELESYTERAREVSGFSEMTFG